VPRYFWERHDTFASSKTLLTAEFSFGNLRTVLGPPKMRWKRQNLTGTVTALFTPLICSAKRPESTNTGLIFLAPS
jgi:hypothetical protein